MMGSPHVSDPTTRLRRAEALFHEALQHPAAQRRELLRQRCGDDAELMDQVQRLLDADARADGFMTAPALGGGFTMPSPEDAGQDRPQRPIGPYQLLRLLGSGGIAYVWLARRVDGQFEKDVALKLVKRGMDTDSILERFRKERQLLARLEHPNIARLIDGGASNDGLPYLVMEYVDGLPIDRYCRERRLSITERVELFRDVCAAVQHAHQNLVIHRDLKPGNILVTADGRPRLLDFGIAKVLTPAEEADHGALKTTRGERLLTPEYASPEQLCGDPITTASDVYSLGVVLYELLTTQPPFEANRAGGGGRSEIEPLRPSTRVQRAARLQGSARVGLQLRDWPEGDPDRLARRLRGDLDTILLKALAAEPTERYGSVEQFSEDLYRYSQRLPIQARPPTRAYRMRRFIQRHAVGVLTGSVAVLAVIAGLIASTILYVRAESARVREVEQRQLADARRAEAEAAGARALAEAAKVQATHAFLLTMLTAGDPSAAFPPNIELRQLVDEAVNALDEGALQDQPGVDAAIRATLARVYLALTLPQKAEPQARRAYESRAAEPGPGTREYAEALTVLASTEHALGRYALSEKLRRESLLLHRRLYGDECLEALRQMHSLVSVLRDQRKMLEGEQLAREALELAIRLTGQRSLETAEARVRLGWLLLYVDLEESEEQIREALAIRETLRGRNDMLVAECLLRLGRTLHAAGDYEGGKAALCEAVSICRDRRGEKHPGTLGYMNYLVILLEGGREYEAAEEVCTQMLEGWRAYTGTYDEQVAVAIASLARIRALRGDSAGAEELHRRALEQMRSRFGEQHPATAAQWGAFAGFLMQQNRLAEAEVTLNEALERQRAALGDTHEFVAGTLDQLAGILERQGRPEECERAMTQSVEILRGARGDDDETVVKRVGQLASVIAARGEPRRAATVLGEHAARIRAVLEAARATPRELGARLALARTLRMQAQTSYASGDFEQAAAVARAAIAAVAVDSPLRRVRVAWADGHYWLGVALLAQRAYADAESVLLQCHRIYSELRVAGRWPTYAKERLVQLYEEWDTAEPDKGHALSAAEWRAKLEAGEKPVGAESHDAVRDP